MDVGGPVGKVKVEENVARARSFRGSRIEAAWPGRPTMEDT